MSDQAVPQLEFLSRGGVSGMMCPLCAGDLRPEYRLGVEIDVCVQCKSIFLDRGELERLIARAVEVVGGGDALTARVGDVSRGTTLVVGRLSQDTEG